MQRKNYLLVALLSMTLIAMEIVWTRIFSAEFFYTYAFLTLSLAILGMGLGALSLRLFPKLNNEKHIPLISALTALLAMGGPIVVLHLGLEFNELFNSWLMLGKFLITLFLLSSAYFCGGMTLAIFFRNYHDHMPRIYMADLLGAGIGIFVAIGLMNWLGTPTATVLLSIPLLIVSLMTARRWQLALPLLLGIVAILLTLQADTLLDKPREERAPVIYKHWDAMSKIKIYDYDEFYRGLNIDNLANSPVYGFDGNWDRPDSMKFEFGIDVSWLINQNEYCSFLSLGAGGGGDVVQALQAGATDIHAVEVNPHINKLMTDGMLADFSGRIYADPRVTVITEDARAYVRRFHNKFDVIYSLSSNTFAALASGSFALAENYLFTTEAFEDYYDALSTTGVMMMEHQFYMPRLVTEVLNALENQGVADPKAHVAFYALPRMRRQMMLLSKQPLTDQVRQMAFGELTPEKWNDIHLLYPAADSISNNLINRIVLDGWETAHDSAHIDISPCTDNRPFTAQLGRWSNFTGDQLKNLRYAEFRGFPLSKLVVVTILGVVILLMLPLTLLPALKKGPKLKPAAWWYFFMLGAAFMILEVVLIQKYTLFIGPSAYTLVTILFTLLVASGIGSRFSEKSPDWLPFVMIALWVLLEITLFTPLKYQMGHLSILPRMALSAILIFPLGYFMGMPFPKGTRKVGELIDWGFAVNGAASVIGSTAVILLAMSAGFTISLAVAVAGYLVAAVLLPRMN